MPTRRFRRIDPKTRREPLLPAIIEVGSAGARIAAEDIGIVITESPEETRRTLRELTSHRVFSMTELKSALRWLGPEFFTVVMLGRSPLRLDLDDGPSILGTRRMFTESRIEEVLLAALTVDQYCRAHGVALGSHGWTAEQFFRISLTADLIVSSPIGRKGYSGGRKACPNPGQYRDLYYVDLRAAYPSAMIEEPFASRLELAPDLSIDWPIGVALAVVDVPESLSAWPPLAEVRSYGQTWRTGEFRGWWTLRELRAARDLGVEVRPEIVLRGADEIHPFRRWWELIGPGRDLSGDAGRWMKAISNALHGTFVLDQTVRIVRFPSGELNAPEVVRTRKPPPLGAAHLGTEITSRVRVRLLRELVPSRPLYIDTDGGIIRTGSPLPEPFGPGIGEWSIRERIEYLDLRGNQAYAFRRWGEETEQIVLAGIPRASRADLDRHPGDVLADTASGWKPRVRALDEPWVFDENGEPVSLSVGVVERVGLPSGWSVRDRELIGVDAAKLPVPF